MATKTKYVVTAYIKDKKGRVLAIGKNSYIKTHPEMVKLGKKQQPIEIIGVEKHGDTYRAMLSIGGSVALESSDLITDTIYNELKLY